VAKGDACNYWILFLDLDGTLWDHKDISSLRPPFYRVDERRIRDSSGVEVRIYDDSVKLLKWARSRGALTSTLSWNVPEIAMEAIRAFGLEELFDYFVIDPSPHKGEAALRLIKRLKEERGCVPPPCAIVYIDDRDIHIDEVRKRLGDVTFLIIWKDFKSFEEAKRLIEERLERCRGAQENY
jgi:magnesium-dependent phosphatase-1